MTIAPKVVVIDYGAGNLGSVKRAFEECGAAAVITGHPEELRQATHLVLPGVGAFNAGMSNLRRSGLDAAIKELVLQKRVQFLGICLGMQLLAAKGWEGGETDGLDLIGGEVKLLEAGTGERLPHMGWNEVEYEKSAPLFFNIPSGTDFYFVHSYHFVCRNKSESAATTPYGGGFISVGQKENICGTQFHPEKSQKPGLQLIKNFLKS